MTSPSVQARTGHLLASLWTRNEPLMRQRIALLAQAATLSESGHLTPDLQEEAISISHKLAGSLGMFGFPTGTDIARELEQDFTAPSSPGSSVKVANLARIMFPQK